MRGLRRVRVLGGEKVRKFGHFDRFVEEWGWGNVNFKENLRQKRDNFLHALDFMKINHNFAVLLEEISKNVYF
ncbi:MAG: hypothetical protein H6581_13685 [Bacteroidia bacterium]|nr:hypothetical protein [Bacteroidia bacterium]